MSGSVEEAKFRAATHLAGVHGMRAGELTECHTGCDELVCVRHRGRNDVVPIGPVELEALVDEDNRAVGRCVAAGQLQSHGDSSDTPRESSDAGIGAALVKVSSPR